MVDPEKIHGRSRKKSMVNPEKIKRSIQEKFHGQSRKKFMVYLEKSLVDPESDPEYFHVRSRKNA